MAKKGNEIDNTKKRSKKQMEVVGEQPEKTEKEAKRTRESRNLPEDQTRRKLVPSRLPAKLRAIRLKHQLSQAEMLCIINPFESEDNRARVSQYERGLRVPSLIEVYNYAKYIGESMEVLVDDNLGLPKRYRNYMTE